jgi:TFIIF-interacting CTD phosphatase-like protein
VIDYLDPNNEYISERYFRDSCYRTNEGFYIKDLRVIDRCLDRMILVDNVIKYIINIGCL